MKKIEELLNEALLSLTEAGADITRVGEDTFLVRDNGFHGFLEETDPFEIDGEDLIEMHDQYLNDK